MRKINDLIYSAFAEENIANLSIIGKSEADSELGLYQVKFLSDRYSGLPQHWYVLILKRPREKTKLSDIKHFFGIIRDKTRACISKKQTPLLIISDNPGVKISDKIRFQNHSVFVMDSSKLPGKNKYTTNIRNAPFLTSVRRKLSSKELSLFKFTPFIPNNPAIDWRFHGRKKEIDKITNSNNSFFIIGARRIGKTSLLLESKRILENSNKRVFYITVQNLATSEEVVNNLLMSLSARDVARAKKKKQLLNEDLLSSVVKTIATSYSGATIILDELGNVLTKNPKDSWRLVGILRDYSQRKKIKVLISGFQEIIIKRLNEPDGPYVNFGEIMRLQAFTDKEINDILINPLKIWGTINNKTRFLKAILKYVGRHPYLIQSLGEKLFEQIFEHGGNNIEHSFNNLIHNSNIFNFAQEIDNIFFSIKSTIIKYVFLKFCYEADEQGTDIITKEMNDKWIKKTLDGIGINANYNNRMLLCDRIELLGLTMSKSGYKLKQFVSAPLIYYYIKRSGVDMKGLVEDFRNEARKSNYLNFLDNI